MAKTMETIQCTGAILVLPDGRWVMQRRTDDAPNDPGVMTFFGGKTEEGETQVQGFEREIKEETDLDLEKLTYKHAADFKIENNGRILDIMLFWVNIPAMDFTVFEGKWAEAFTVEELAKRTDVSNVVPRALQLLTEKKHGA